MPRSDEQKTSPRIDEFDWSKHLAGACGTSATFSEEEILRIEREFDEKQSREASRISKNNRFWESEYYDYQDWKREEDPSRSSLSPSFSNGKEKELSRRNSIHSRSPVITPLGTPSHGHNATQGILHRNALSTPKSSSSLLFDPYELKQIESFVNSQVSPENNALQNEKEEKEKEKEIEKDKPKKKLTLSPSKIEEEMKRYFTESKSPGESSDSSNSSGISQESEKSMAKLGELVNYGNGNGNGNINKEKLTPNIITMDYLTISPSPFSNSTNGTRSRSSASVGTNYSEELELSSDFDESMGHSPNPPINNFRFNYLHGNLNPPPTNYPLSVTPPSFPGKDDQGLPKKHHHLNGNLQNVELVLEA